MKHLIYSVIIYSLTVFFGASISEANNIKTLFQKPTLSEEYIVFAYAGDLWRVDRDGGQAQSLTSGIGIESDPYFSPNGKLVAFTGQYDGNTDVYVMNIEGGTPTRLTYHPSADIVVGWTNDSDNVLFSSGRASFANFLRLFTIPNTGGNPTQLPLPSVERGSYSPNGKYLAYEPLNQWQPDWKRYHGGQQDYINIAKLSDSAVTKIPKGDSNDKYPMWIGDKVYFLSDRNSEEGTVRLFVYDPKSYEVKQLLDHKGMDIKAASAGPDGVIAYEEFGSIHLYNTKTNRSSKVDISVNVDATSARAKYKKVGKNISSYSISPTGQRAVFEARGEIITLPKKDGNPRNITNTPGIMERSPSWSPNGYSIAYFSDEGGEYNLHIRDQKGENDALIIPLPKTFYYGAYWAPDSKKIAILSKKLQLWILDLEAEDADLKLVDTALIGMPQDIMEPTWSKDSKWIAYANQLPNLLRVINLYSLETSEITQVTDGMSDARYPSFDESGKYLYFTASTDMGGTISFADMSGAQTQTSRSVYAIVLPNDLASPLEPKSDEEKIKTSKPEKEKEPKEVNKKGDGAKDEEGTKEKEIKIDLDGIMQRIVPLPIPSKNFTDLQAGSEGTIYITESIPQNGGRPSNTLHSFDFKSKKFKKVMGGIRGFEMSANKKQALYSKGPMAWFISAAEAIGKPTAPDGSGVLKIGAMETFVNPKEEWKQMFKAVWRGERDFFYDVNGHGIDFDRMEAKYEPYLAAVNHREDLNYLFRDMLNEMTIGHMFIRGGDIKSADPIPGGLLGADYNIEGENFKFSKIYNGESWNPGLKAPLAQPGLNIKAGEYLFQVNGRDITSNDNFYSHFETTAGKQIRIKVGPNADGSDTRELIVVPVPSENQLRYIDWIEGNRRKVDELSKGQLAYIHMPNTAGAGITSFNRYFFSQTDKNGAILDERFNGGGLLADYVTQLFKRNRLGNVHYREGSHEVPMPAGAIYGPKAMLINERAGSGGDAMPWIFKKEGVGPLIGKQTWGGLVASRGVPRLLDGGGVTAPDAAIYGLEGEWEMENMGAKPDIEVEFDPALWRQGRDPQLEAAVAYLLGELKKNPPKEYKIPDFPVYKRDYN